MSADDNAPAAPDGAEAPMVRAYRATFAWEEARLTPFVDGLVAAYRQALLHPEDPKVWSYDEETGFQARVLSTRFLNERPALIEEVMALIEPDMRAELREMGVEAQFLGQLEGMVDDAGAALAERFRACAAECREASTFLDKDEPPPTPRCDYRAIDWQQGPPTAAALAAAFDGWRIAELAPLRPELAAVVDICHDWANGHAAAAQFVLDLDPALAFYVTRNRLHEIPFFDRFFRHEAVRARLLGLETLTWEEGAAEGSCGAQVGPSLGFEHRSAWVSVAGLAARIAAGSQLGPRNSPDDGGVLELIRGVADAAFESRYSEVLAYDSWKPWSSWFFAHHEDSSFFWLDKATGLATVLMITDSY